MPAQTPEIPPRQLSDRNRRQPRTPLWRLRMWQLLIFAGLLAIVGRLYYLQIYKGAELTQRAQEQRQQNKLLVHRGAITDRHGLPLAIDTTRYDIYVHTNLLKVTADEAVETFARITHQKTEKIQQLFDAGYPIITLARHLGREEVDELQALNWTGIDVVPRSFRHYPEGRLASHLLGYVNMDTRGQNGVEQTEEETLQNTGSLPKPQLDGRGHPIVVGTSGPSTTEVAPPMGRHVELTIDNYLQHLSEKELSAMCYHSHAQRGTALILDPQSGEILSWANWPNYDPNEYSKFKIEVMKNWAMVDVYQPGSTFKVITVASGLDLGTINLNSTFYDSGQMKIGNRTIHNHEPGGRGVIGLKQLFINSSNIASAQIGLSMTPQQFYDKLREFGFGRPTGVGLPGESAGLLSSPDKWMPIDQATTGFGQGAISVTPLQLVAAVGAVANGGVRVQPHIIRRIYDPRSGVTERWTQTPKYQVIKPDTASAVCRLLSQNVAEGTQLAGKVPGYSVAGKTGTAQKVLDGSRGYVAGQTIASFIGFLPYEHAQLLCLVVIDSPQTDGRWGNTIAGPVFNAICVEAARYLGIPPSHPIELNNKKMAAAGAFIAPSIKYAAEVPPDKCKPLDAPPPESETPDDPSAAPASPEQEPQ